MLMLPGQSPSVRADNARCGLADELGWNDPLLSLQWHLVLGREYFLYCMLCSTTKTPPASTTSMSFLYGRKVPVHLMLFQMAFKIGVFGKGITVCLLDCGVDHTHPDISDAYISEASYDMNEKTDRVKFTPSEPHATRCAAEIVAKADNGVCGVGVAPLSNISNVRILSGEVPARERARALNYRMDMNDVYSCSWGPKDDGQTLDGPDPYALAALLRGVLFGRQGLGSIYLVAAGNGGASQDHCNADGYANSPFTLTIGAITIDDAFPSYMEHCPAMLAVTYSSSDRSASGKKRVADPAGIVTCDPNDSCTIRHGGTSAAAPIAAGILSLFLSERPELTWRDVQGILISSAVKPTPREAFLEETMETFIDNHAGHPYSVKFGFGKMNAHRAYEVSKGWKPVGPPLFVSVKSGHGHCVYRDIPFDGDGLPITWVVSPETADLGCDSDKHFGDSFLLEHVLVQVTIKHKARGQIHMTLTSPSGTQVMLMEKRPRDISKSLMLYQFEQFFLSDGTSKACSEDLSNETARLDGESADNQVSWEFGVEGGFNAWTLSTLAFYHEPIKGTWVLRIVDDIDADLQGSIDVCSCRISFLGENTKKESLDLGEKAAFMDSVFRFYFPNLTSARYLDAGDAFSDEAHASHHQGKHHSDRLGPAMHSNYFLFICPLLFACLLMASYMYQRRSSRFVYTPIS